MSTALYRRYRPETFAEVIGQEHVTEPLMTALQNNRVNHAYLFSGPRGCGKTTSARILARCLNCAEGPTPTPCGVCDSCVELARDGSGSLDVIEMDAASHGGVDHARDLRERATFAPVRDRYKIFIIDEAHMVTREGFNALLKIVEEPPEHIKFIFATTEPNKVLGTIRSRTHHYPFRLVPPETLHDYLAKLCEEEGVKVEDGVLQLVVRAGGGSVRDSLSTLDQLMAGSGEEGITYDLAVALLGFTHAELLDEVVIAFATGNAADVFTAVDRVIQTGQDPRRFVEDLLERFRDLIIVQAVPEAAESILHGMSADQIGRLRSQASAFGAAELSRAADVTNAGLNEMSGATSPQLHLELLCARILLPASDKTVGGVGARLDRLERRVANGDIPAPTQAPAQAPVQVASAPVAPQQQAPSNVVSPQAQAQAQAQGNSASSPVPAPEQMKTAPLANLRKKQEDPVPAPVSASTPQNRAPQNTVAAARNAWSEIVDHVQSPAAREGFSKCEPSKFENGALYIRANIQTLRQVKNFIPQLKTALREVIQLDADVHAEVAKSGAPAPRQQNNTPPLQRPSNTGGNANSNGSSNSWGNRNQPQNPAPSQGQPQNSQPEIAEGPRGGEEAWRAHGQPRSTEAPQWSTEDWNNPVTDWAVASIPSEQPSEEENHSQPSRSEMNTANSMSENTQPHPGNESGPQLRVIDGEGNENANRSRVNHPSSGMWQRPDIAAAPTPDDVDEGVAAPVDTTDAASSEQSAADPVTQGEETAEESGESSPLAATPDKSQGEDNARYTEEPDTRPANTGIADGTAEAAPAEDSMIPDPPQADQNEPNSETSAAGTKANAQSGASAGAEDENSGPKELTERTSSRQIADEYGNYEGGHFDDAPAEEPEYVAGVGYVKNEAPSGVLPPLAPQAGQRQADSVSPARKVEESPQPSAESTPTQKTGGFRERFAAQLAEGHRASENASAPSVARGSQEPEDFSISEEDEALETSVLIGQRAVEKVLGGVVIEERPHGA